MKIRRILAISLCCGLSAVVLLVLYVAWNIQPWAAGFHQKSVARSLAEWEKEYGRIDSWDEADRAIGMLEYVQTYYVPGPGYRSDPQTEAALEAQRARTLAAIASALREFSEEDFGTDAGRWRAWQAEQRRWPRQGEERRR